MVKGAALVFVCGLVAVYGATESRIVGGLTAPEGAFPHQVSIRVYNQHFCGGSIVNPTTILTAAHCLLGDFDISLMTVVVGTNSLTSGGRAHQVSKAIPHPMFDTTTTINDIAILKLAEPISYDKLVGPIKLATKQPVGNKAVTLSGWGLTKYPGQMPATNLQYISLKTLPLQNCANKNPTSQPITTGQVCTTSPAGKGACQGDSGGPLITEDKEQIGVVSWGIPCAVGYPDVFTSVVTYRNWIAQYE